MKKRKERKKEERKEKEKEGEGLHEQPPHRGPRLTGTPQVGGDASTKLASQEKKRGRRRCNVGVLV